MSRVELVVDAANVVGSRPDGWWRDRPGAAARLVAALAAALRSGALTSPVTVILEGAARAGVPATPTETGPGQGAGRGGGDAAEGARSGSGGDAADETGAGSGGDAADGTGAGSGGGGGAGAEADGAMPTLRVLHAPTDGDSAIVAEVIALVGAGAEVTVVTADRGLRARVVAAGGDVVGPSWLRDRLP